MLRDLVGLRDLDYIGENIYKPIGPLIAQYSTADMIRLKLKIKLT